MGFGLFSNGSPPYLPPCLSSPLPAPALPSPLPVPLTSYQSTREDAAAKESELRAQIEKLRSEKRELEARSGGVDLAKIKVRVPDLDLEDL